MMRIVTLNAWGGTLFAPLMDFIQRESKHTDVFCFQEIFSSPEKTENRGRRMNLLEELVLRLPDFDYVFAPTLSGRDHGGPVNFEVAFGNATFVRRNITFTSQTIPVYDGFNPDSHGNHPRKLLAVSLEQPSVCVGNIHGLWVPTGKDDTPDRIEQSRRIIDFAASQSKPVVLAGDFNLRPETESIAMLSARFHNLVAINRVTNTRTRHYQDMEKYRDYIADYVFVSPELKIRALNVLPDIVSDHRALAVELA